jgi:hypothetical protein
VPELWFVALVPAFCPLDSYIFSSSRYLMQRAEETARKWLDGGRCFDVIKREPADNPRTEFGGNI